MIPLFLIFVTLLIVYLLAKSKKRRLVQNNNSLNNSSNNSFLNRANNDKQSMQNGAPNIHQDFRREMPIQTANQNRNVVAKGNTLSSSVSKSEGDIGHKKEIEGILNALKLKIENQDSIGPVSEPSQAAGNKGGDIVDVSAASLDLSIDHENGSGIDVPDWTHQYVYSYNEIHAASQAQKDFYKFFKIEFEKGNCVDLQGNWNYAFILLFDLFNEYEQNKDLPLLENHLNVLSREYPRTQRYAQTFFHKIKYPSLSSPLDRYSYPSDYDEEYWKLGSRFKSKLNLSEAEVNFLNKIWNQTNNFCSIEFCYLEIIKLFLLSLKKLEKEYKPLGISLDALIEEIADIVARKQFRYRKGSENYNYSIQSTTNQVWGYLFRICENLVRETYGHKRKLNVEITFISAPEALQAFRDKILSRFIAISSNLTSTVQQPDEATEIELNIQNPTRWKIAYEGIVNSFKGDTEKFLEAVLALGGRNDKNPSVENIFFEASKFMAKYDKVIALKLYVYYIHYDLKSDFFDNKQHGKTIQKSLFTSEQQVSDFTALIGKFIQDQNLQAALDAVPSIYAVKRKKIELDRNSIYEVNNRHAETVSLLNEILADEEDTPASTGTNIAEATGIEAAEIVLEIPGNNNDIQRQPSSAFSGEIKLSAIQEQSLNYFIKNNYSIAQSDFEEFARANGVLKNQLIESINERCYEMLDDLLIEEEDDFYTLNHLYYQQLLA